ncbi:MAG: 2-hydroxyacid dehydrogenase [Candidatus Baldrarchaeia archaeon]
MKCVVCGDPAISSKRIYQIMKELEQENISFECIDWKGDLSIAQFYSEILKIERLGPEGVEPFNELTEAVKDADFLIVHYAPVSKNTVSQAKNLKMIGCIRGGYENVNVKAAREKGIYVLNAPGRTTSAVADFTMGLILALVRRIPEFHYELKQGKWMTVDRNNLPLNLEDMTLGIIGFGNIGKAVARRAQGFGMKILAYDPYVKEVPRDLNVKLTGLEELLKNSDIITVHARLSPESYHLIGEKEFKLMKKGAYFVNTARSGLVDTDALINALEQRWIAGAALDVFDEEPLSKDSKLLKLDNVIVTPHIAGSTLGTFQNGPKLMVKEIRKILKEGKPSFTL